MTIEAGAPWFPRTHRLIATMTVLRRDGITAHRNLKYLEFREAVWLVEEIGKGCVQIPWKMSKRAKSKLS